MSKPRACKLMGGPRDGDTITLTTEARHFEQVEVSGKAKFGIVDTCLEKVVHRWSFSHKDDDFYIFNYQGVVER